MVTAVLVATLALGIAATSVTFSLVNGFGGLNPDRLVTTSVDLSLRGYTPVEGNRFWVRLLDEVKRLPRTEAASLAVRLPLDIGMSMQQIAPEGYQARDGRGWPSTEFATVETEYLHTIGTPLLAGREFTERDTVSALPVIIVNRWCFSARRSS